MPVQTPAAIVPAGKKQGVPPFDGYIAWGAGVYAIGGGI